MQSLQSSFIRNVAVLTGGRAGAQMISFLLTPVIARLFTPDNYGFVALLFVVSQLIGDISTLNYHRAVVIPKTVEKSARILALSKVVLAIFVLLLLLVWLGLEVMGIGIPYSGTLGAWVWVIPLVVGIIGMGNIRAMALTRSKEFGVIAKAGIGQALATTGSRIGLGILFGSTVWGLASGYMLGLIVRVGMLGGRTETYTVIVS